MQWSCRGENSYFWSLTHWVNLIPSGCHGNLPITKASPRRQCNTGRILPHERPLRLITYLNSNHTNYLAQLSGRFFLGFGKFLPQICESCGASYWRNCETFSAFVKHIMSSNRWWKQRPNPCITGDAILPQTGKNWPKNAVRNLAVCCGAIWHHIEIPQYRCTTTIHHVYNSPRDVLENLLPVWLLVRSFRAVFGLSIRILTLALSAI